MNVDIFYKTPKDLEKAVGYVSCCDGEYKLLRSTDKRVVVYLLDRLNFFVERLKGEHFESQDTIATALGMNYQAVGKCLRELVEHGFVAGEKKKPSKGGKERWFYYSVNTDVVLWIGNQDSPILLDKQGNPVGVPTKTLRKSTNKVVQKQHTEVEEDFEPPF